MTNIKMKVGEIHSKLILDKDNDALIAFHQQGKNSQFLLKTTLYFAKEKNADALYHFANCFWCGTLSPAHHNLNNQQLKQLAVVKECPIKTSTS